MSVPDSANTIWAMWSARHLMMPDVVTRNGRASPVRPVQLLPGLQISANIRWRCEASVQCLEKSVKVLAASCLLAVAVPVFADPIASPWIAPEAPTSPAQTSKVYVLLTADAPRIVRVCYTVGADGSHVIARTNTSGQSNSTTPIYKGACADLGGTSMEIINPNKAIASGTYERQPLEK